MSGLQIALKYRPLFDADLHSATVQEHASPVQLGAGGETRATSRKVVGVDYTCWECVCGHTVWRHVYTHVLYM